MRNGLVLTMLVAIGLSACADHRPVASTFHMGNAGLLGGMHRPKPKQQQQQQAPPRRATAARPPSRAWPSGPPLDGPPRDGPPREPPPADLPPLAPGSAVVVIGESSVALAGVPRSTRARAEFQSVGARPALVAKATGAIAADPICDAADRRMSAEDCALFIAQQRKIAAGVAGFRPPRDMLVGESQTVQFAVAAGTGDAGAERLGQLLDSAPGTVKVRQATLGRYMGARLTGAAFGIAPAAERIKALGSGTGMTWSWDVTAKVAGLQDLSLDLTLYADPEGKIRIEEVPTQPFRVTVGVRSVDRWEGWMAAAARFVKAPAGVFTAIAALIAAIGGVVLAIRKFGRPA